MVVQGQVHCVKSWGTGLANISGMDPVPLTPTWGVAGWERLGQVGWATLPTEEAR